MGSTSGSAVSRKTSVVAAGIFAVVLAAALWFTASARAAETLYWDNYNEGTISNANIDGSGGGPLNLTGIALENPEGMAYDSITNRLFVANSSGGPGGKGEIDYVNLDGSGAGVLSTPGAPIDDPVGIAVDPVARRAYWVNDGTTGSIAYANLDGSGGGLLNTTGATVDGPYRLGFDPVAGRIYWGNSPGPGPETISFANTNNSGGGNLDLTGATPAEGVDGFAVDPAGGRLYWINDGTTFEGIAFASLGGGSGGHLSVAGGRFMGPYGLAFDPALGRLYWANYDGGSPERLGALGFLNLGGGAGNINIATAPVKGPQDPVILKSPSGTGAPAATRSAKSRSRLECSSGSWAVDYPGSYVYQAPRSIAYQWTRNGVPVAGATATSYNAKSAGSYACVVTATNQTGTGSQTSAAVKVKSAKVKLSVKKKTTVKAGGVAKFTVKGVNLGDIQSRKARICVKLPKSAKGALKAPKCKTLGKLKGRGKHGATLKVKVGKAADGTYKVTFTVHGSAGTSSTAKILVVSPKK